MKNSEIKFNISLDDDKVPESISWEATDSTNTEPQSAKSIMISVWDHEFKNTLKIDLWTKDMPVDEMKQFFYETLLTMSDSFEKATGEKAIMGDLRDYCEHFADKMGLKMNL